MPRLRLCERGFTLSEVLAVLAIAGILFALAAPVWWSVSESRAVDSAANQLAADLRLAHTGATNRLEDRVVVLTSGDATYTIGPAGETPAVRTLPEGTRVATGAALIFTPRGSVEPPEGTITVRVRSVGDPENYRDVEINTTTSRVRIVE